MQFFSLHQVLALAREKFPNLGKRVDEAGALAAWPEAVGAQISKHTRALWVRDGSHLVVEVDHPVWQTQLRHLEPKILERLQRITPAIKSLEFQDRSSLKARESRIQRARFRDHKSRGGS